MAVSGLDYEVVSRFVDMEAHLKGELTAKGVDYDALAAQRLVNQIIGQLEVDDAMRDKHFRDQSNRQFEWQTKERANRDLARAEAEWASATDQIEKMLGSAGMGEMTATDNVLAKVMSGVPIQHGDISGKELDAFVEEMERPGGIVEMMKDPGMQLLASMIQGAEQDKILEEAWAEVAAEAKEKKGAAKEAAPDVAPKRRRRRKKKRTGAEQVAHLLEGGVEGPIAPLVAQLRKSIVSNSILVGCNLQQWVILNCCFSFDGAAMKAIDDDFARLLGKYIDGVVVFFAGEPKASVLSGKINGYFPSAAAHLKVLNPIATNSIAKEMVLEGDLVEWVDNGSDFDQFHAKVRGYFGHVMEMLKGVIAFEAASRPYEALFALVTTRMEREDTRELMHAAVELSTMIQELIKAGHEFLKPIKYTIRLMHERLHKILHRMPHRTVLWGTPLPKLDLNLEGPSAWGSSAAESAKRREMLKEMEDRKRTVSLPISGKLVEVGCAFAQTTRAEQCIGYHLRSLGSFLWLFTNDQLKPMLTPQIMRSVSSLLRAAFLTQTEEELFDTDLVSLARGCGVWERVDQPFITQLGAGGFCASSIKSALYEGVESEYLAMYNRGEWGEDEVIDSVKKALHTVSELTGMEEIDFEWRRVGGAGDASGDGDPLPKLVKPPLDGVPEQLVACYDDMHVGAEQLHHLWILLRSKPQMQEFSALCQASEMVFYHLLHNLQRYHQGVASGGILPPLGTAFDPDSAPFLEMDVNLKAVLRTLSFTQLYDGDLRVGSPPDYLDGSAISDVVIRARDTFRVGGFVTIQGQKITQERVTLMLNQLATLMDRAFKLHQKTIKKSLKPTT